MAEGMGMLNLSLHSCPSPKDLGPSRVLSGSSCLLPSQVTPSSYIFLLPILAPVASLKILLGSDKNLGLLQITPLAGKVPGASGLTAKPPAPANLLKEGDQSEQNLGLQVEAGLGLFQH